MNSRIPPSGFILLDKPSGVTSCKALYPIRQIFDTRRVGHAGSLDLRASGLIVAAVGRATRLLSYVEAGEKSYTFEAHFGYATDTDEWDGELVEQDPETSPISPAAVLEAIPRFLGRIEQVPPDFSAVKLNGRRASDLKLKGRNFELKSRPIQILKLELLGQADSPEGASGRIRSSFRFACDCSKGTYIRSLVRDLGKALGTFGAVSHIRRTRIGDFSVENAVIPDELGPGSLLKPQDYMKFPVATLTEKQVVAVRNGRPITWNREPFPIPAGAPNVVLAVDAENDLKAACEFENGALFPKFYIGSEDA